MRSYPAMRANVFWRVSAIFTRGFELERGLGRDEKASKGVEGGLL